MHTASTATARPDRTWANGSPPTSRAHAARYAAHQPFSHAIRVAAAGERGSIAAEASASPSSGTTAGAASAFAGTLRSGIAWNCSQRTGAVMVPHAVDTATTV